MTIFERCGLTPIEECITKMRCGVNCKPHTSWQIAAELGVKREKIHKIEAGALRKLRSRLETRESAETA